MSQPRCHVCGGTEFAVDAGFYYCSECQTQSQEIREFVFDEYFAGQKATTRVLVSKPVENAVKEAAVKLTSWEILNYILKGLVDETIELGAKPEVKQVTLQLWAKYLRNLEVAFLSTNVPHKPRLDVNFRSGDAEIMYGITTKHMRRSDVLLKLKSRSRTASDSSNSSSRSSSSSAASSSADSAKTGSDSHISRRSHLMRLSAQKKKLAAAEYETMSSSLLDKSQNYISLEDFGNVSTVTYSSKPERVKLTKHARSVLKEKFKAAARMKKGKREFEKNVCRNEARRTITVAKLVALLRLALLLADQRIYTSDILRWIAEGHLSVLNCKVFLPKEVIVKGDLKRIIEKTRMWSSFGQKSYMVHLCSLLGINKIPVPNLSSLAIRYCKELQLPDDFTKAVCNWLTALPKNMFRPTTNYEVITMSVILIQLKMLFSLDGKTEDNLSQLAKEVGRLSPRQQKLFVWNDWVHYIECRKVTVASHHFPTHMALFGKIQASPEVFFNYEQYLKARMPDDEENAAAFHGIGKGSQIWVAGMRTWLENMGKVDSCQHELISFPPSLTPMYTYTQILLEQYSDRLSREVKAILSQDFTKHSVEYALHPERFVSNNADRGIKIVIHDGPSNNFDVVKVLKEKEIVARRKINTETVFVHLNVEKKEKDEDSFNKKDSDIEDSGSTELVDDEFVSDHSSLDSYDDDNGNKNKGKVVMENDLDESRHVDLDESRHIVDSLPQTDKTENKKTYTLNVVSTKYWCHYQQIKRLNISNNDTELQAGELFPPPFLWLLRECARMINTTVRDLYLSVMTLEKMCQTFSEQKQGFRFNK